MLTPNSIAATTYSQKLACCSANAATHNARAADSDDNAKPLRLPILRISIVAGMVVAAIATTIIESGKVARALLLLSVDPIIPPNVTMTIEPVAEIS